MGMVTYFCPLLNFSFLGCGGTHVMTQWLRLKVLATKPSDQSLISGTHMVEGEKDTCGCLLTFTCISWYICIHMHTN